MSNILMGWTHMWSSKDAKEWVAGDRWKDVDRLGVSLCED
jgi:hypothetical protein